MDISYNPFSLEGKTILVTGASSGIGRATAMECSKLGAKVIVTARNQERLADTLNALQGDGHSTYIADLANPDDVDQLVTSLPTLDGVVNNAGMNKILPIQFVTSAELMTTMQVNAISPILSVIGTLDFLDYRQVKSELEHERSQLSLLESDRRKEEFIAKELAVKKIRCNEVLPGQADTAIMSQGAVSEEQMSELTSRIPMKRLGNPDEIAMSITFLLSDAASYITGASLIIDGGLSL